MRNSRSLAFVAGLLALAPFAQAAPQKTAVSPEAEATYRDIQQTLGLVPEFMRAVPQSAIGGAWAEMKSIQLNPSSAIPPKYKELIGLGVSAQIPCQYCIYFHTQAARAHGATDEQIRLAVSEAALTRHWSTVLNGQEIDETTYRTEVGRALNHAKQMMAAPPTNTPMPARTADEARNQIAQAFGFVPGFMNGFPEEGLAGAWNEMHAIEMTPGPVPDKYVTLVGLAVSAQIPCHYCVYFDTQAAKTLSNASDREISESVALAGIVRHWSTLLNGLQIDEKRFRKDTDQIMENMKKTAAKSAER